MITPEFLNKIIEELEQKVADLNNDMTKKIAKKMASSFYAHMPKNERQLLNMIDKENVYDDILKAINKHKKDIDDEVKNAYMKSACEISNHNTDIAKQIIKNKKLDVELPQYARNTTKSSQMNLTPKEVEKVKDAYGRGIRTVNNLTGTMPSDGQSAYINACNNAYLKVKAGQSLDDALMTSIDEMAQQGITHVNYDSGRRERVEVAIARSVRTGINQMNAELVLQRCATMGINYVQVSQHLGARDTGTGDYRSHVTWQGKVYTLDWNKSVFKRLDVTPDTSEQESFNWLDKIKQSFAPKRPVYPDFVEKCGFGNPLGIFGYNCRHTIRLFIPEINQEEEPLNPTENELQYEAEQKARAMERGIRETKRRIDALEYSGLDNTETTEKLHELKTKYTQQLNHYNEHMKKYDEKLEKWRITTVQDYFKNPSKYSIMYIQEDYAKMMKNRKIFKLSQIKNGLPIKGEPNSIADKVTDNDKVLQRRVYGSDGIAVVDFDTTDHKRPFDHPTYGHKNMIDITKKNPHHEPEPLTNDELILNRDIYTRGVNYFDKK